MRFYDATALFTFPFFTNDAPVSDTFFNGYQMGAFFANWVVYQRQHFVTDLPASKLTKISYAFANVNATTGNVFLSDEEADIQMQFPGDVPTNGTDLFGNFNQLFKLKQQYRNLKVSLSIGGWTFNESFRTALATNATRWNFAQSALALVADLGLDGVNVDWEYPKDETDGKNFVETVKLIRTVFDNYSAQHASGYHFQIDISAPAGPRKYAVFPIAAMDAYVDEWNLMAFTYVGVDYSERTCHASNIHPSTSNPHTTAFNTAQVIDYYRARVASPKKLILGMPLYGRTFAHTDGLGHPFNGSGPGTWEPGVLQYKSLSLAGSSVYTDKEAIASWSYDNKTRQFISFDTPEIQTLKSDYLKREQLGGAWWWDTSYDRSDDKSLISTVFHALGGTPALQQNENWLSYPLSKYDSVRCLAFL